MEVIQIRPSNLNALFAQFRLVRLMMQYNIRNFARGD